MYRLGIDLGGTNIVAGIVDEKYRILAKRAVKTGLPATSQQIVAKMLCVSREAARAAGIERKDISAAGKGSPVNVDSETGIVQYASNLGFRNVPLAEEFRRLSGIPTFVSNDANAAAYAEFLAGAGKGSTNFVAITLGTGIGGGIVLGSKIYRGQNNSAGEIGHMILKKGGRKCTCGQRGCFETYASATALTKDTITVMKKDTGSILWQLCGTDLQKIDGKTAFAAMRMGDAAAKAVVQRYIEHLGAGILSLIRILSPDCICLGGGISGEGDALLEPVCAYIRQQGCTMSVKVCAAALGNDAGIIGAAYSMDANDF